MIRFVYIRKEDEVFPDSDGFAWFDTVTDLFITMGGEDVWESWESFEESWHFSGGEYSN